MIQQQKAQQLAKAYHTFLINNECNARFAWARSMELMRRVYFGLV